MPPHVDPAKGVGSYKQQDCVHGSESTKECVATHLPNGLAPKMENAQACALDSTVGVSATRKRLGGRGDREAAVDVSLGETVSRADLGGSSKYSYETYDEQSGERFHVNSNWTWVLRDRGTPCPGPHA